jgi:hypothetical protein
MLNVPQFVYIIMTITITIVIIVFVITIIISSSIIISMTKIEHSLGSVGLFLPEKYFPDVGLKTEERHLFTEL